VRVPEQATPDRVEAARQRAQKALNEARFGADFAGVAASYSDAPDALQGGALGWRSHERLPELFANALAGCSPGRPATFCAAPPASTSSSWSTGAAPRSTARRWSRRACGTS
jgi:peptidyl-prolyl cis-trans isomerase SurA